MKNTFRVWARKSMGLFTILTLLFGVVGCSSESDDSGSGSGTDTGSAGSDTGIITVATTDKLTALDPAGSFDNGSLQVKIQVFPQLFNYDHETKAIAPDLAISGEYTSPDVYIVKMKPDLKWSDDSPLTSEDVKFSFDRMIAINDENGPASLLTNLVEVTTPDESTVEFKLANQNDVVFQSILSSPAGFIVPKAVFAADKLTDEETIVNAGVFAGQYKIKTFKANEFIEFEVNPNYAGIWGPAQSSDVQLTYLAEASNLKLGIANGDFDVAYCTLSPSDIEDLRSNQDVKVVQGLGGEERYIVFNIELLPFGAKTDTADPAKALAVRQAIAHLVDRNQIAETVYKNTYTPLYSALTDGLPGAVTSYKDLYGDGQGGPDLEKAKAVIEAAGIQTPIELKLQYNSDHYGASSVDEYGLIKNQLEASGLFSVDLQGTEWGTYVKERFDSYPAYQLGMFPDYPDPDNGLSARFTKENILNNGYYNEEVDNLISAEQTELDQTKRISILEEIQTLVAQDVPILPLLQGDQIAVVRANIEGADKILDPAFKFTFGYLTKS
ncbi:MAG: ABC transporter substrate-binding protein [Bifidobacteriaceae bacterium]|jgi:peptide/nickel transport system substrate-binding protein|nr:ABC transporter substrate-binding protein [Bifidobacteriaceae bacterium]